MASTSRVWERVGSRCTGVTRLPQHDDRTKVSGFQFRSSRLGRGINHWPEGIAANVIDRISFIAHDFFRDQPVLGMDVYILR